MTEMIRELMIQSGGGISGGFWFFPAGRYAAEISGLCGHYRRCRMAGVPGIDAGGNLAGGGGIFFQSGSGSAEPGICTRVKSARHDLSGGRNPADGAGRIDLPERLFSDTGTDKMVQFYSDPDDPDSGGGWRLPSLLWIHCSVCSGIKRRSGTGRQVETALNPAKIINMI